MNYSLIIKNLILSHFTGGVRTKSAGITAVTKVTPNDGHTLLTITYGGDGVEPMESHLAMMGFPQIHELMVLFPEHTEGGTQYADVTYRVTFDLGKLPATVSPEPCTLQPEPEPLLTQHDDGSVASAIERSEQEGGSNE